MTERHLAISPGVAAILDDTLMGLVERHVRASVGQPGYQSSCRGVDPRTGRPVIVYIGTIGDLSAGPVTVVVCPEDEWSAMGLPAWASETPWPSDN